MNLSHLLRFDLTTKLALMATAITIIFCLAMGMLYQTGRDNSFKARQTEVKQQTDSAWSVLNHYVKLEKSGDLSREEAQKQAIAAIKSMSYGESGYFWINDMQPRMIMHPKKPALDGKDLSAVEDKRGTKLFVEFVNVSRKRGGGFVNYLWPKPDFDTPIEKISYVKRLPAWDWIIGNGLYVDDVEVELSNIRTTGLIALLIVVLVTALLVWLVNRSVSGPINELRRAVYRLSRGETGIKIDCGKPVNCSEKKDCGETDCPSFNKTDVCWVTSGSYAVDKSCPHALRGEDCRTCPLYGPKNNMQELGSALMALANGTKDRAILARQIADGDLTKVITVSGDNDDLGMALVQMHQNLKNMLHQVQVVSGQINNGSTDIENTSQSLTDGASRQAASLEEINSSVALMADQTRRNADNASQANTLANSSKEAAEKGNQQMASLVGAMAEINQAGQDISKIIKVIDEIAFQTNLLALNAAVEAARAGQHGKGFAVVAEEVRNLAARSAKAAQETAELIEGSVQKASNGAGLADTTAAALNEIVNGITKATDLIGEIAAASNEQASNTNQINSGLNQIDEVGQQNTAFSEKTAATAAELATQARQLDSLLSRFKLEESSNNLKTKAAPIRKNVSPAPRSTRQPSPQKAIPATTPKASPQSNGWDNLNSPTDKQPPIIALDDDEFGKY